MEWKQQYFLWNNKQSFARGQSQNIRSTEAGLTLCENEGDGIYYTRICDSKKQYMEWDRLILEGMVPYPKDVHIAIYTCEVPYIVVRNHRYDLHELLRNPSISIAQKDILFEECKQKEFFYQKDQLLQGVTGRYLWMRLKFDKAEGMCARIWRIQILFPRRRLVSFLPELYQGEKFSFLDRFLAIFQSMYEDMNRRIEEIPGRYYAPNTPSDMLIWLSQWLSIEDPYLWNEEQLRYLIQHGVELAGLRGTAAYMRRMIWLYTGVSPYIVEYWQWAYEEMDSRRRNVMKHLYGDDSFCVTVIIEERAVKKRSSLSALEKLVEKSSPAHIDIRIEILKPYIFLDQHAYLGINSYLEGWSDALLDEQKFLPFVVLRNKEKQYEG